MVSDEGGAEHELARSPLVSEELGIRLAERSEDALFRWFLASLLFGGRIHASVADCTYDSFVLHRLTNPWAILDAGWSFLVNPVMRQGGYIRYDESKSRQILRDCRTLVERYRGSLQALHDAASDSADLEERVDAFYGVGPVTTNIFLRELRPFWAKADPAPLPWVVEEAEARGIDLGTIPRKSLRFARIEAGLVRLHLAHGRRRPTGLKAHGCAARRLLQADEGPPAEI